MNSIRTNWEGLVHDYNQSRSPDLWRGKDCLVFGQPSDPSRSALKRPLAGTGCPIEISVHRIPGIQLIEIVRRSLDMLSGRGETEAQKFVYQYANAAGHNDDARPMLLYRSVPK